jgi:prepilin peptidase CpaA
MHSFTTACLLLLLLAAVWHDIRSRRIPNGLVFSGMVAGLLLNTLLPETMGGVGIVGSATGLGLGLLLLLPFHLLRVMGAGDVKLMAMAGAFLGPLATLGALPGIFLAGGVLALLAGWQQGKLRKLFANLQVITFGGAASDFDGQGKRPKTSADSIGDLPYGVAIAVGTVAYLAATTF